MIVSASIPPERVLFQHRPALVKRLLSGDIPAGSGHWAEIEPTTAIDDMPRGNVILCYATDVYCFPRRGLLLRGDGTLLESTVKGSRLSMDRIAKLPGMRRVGDTLHFTPPRNVTSIDRAMLWMNFGAGDNYGHFLFDALPALSWADQAGLLAQFPSIAPPSVRWQRDLMSAAGMTAPMNTLPDPVVHIAQVIYTSCLNHYLHRNGDLMTALAGRFDAAIPAKGPPIYFSRRGFSGRIMINEQELEAALQAKGVRILRPEKMTVAAQRAAVAAAPVLIGASGAALANVIFQPKGSRLVEIRPDPVREPWLDLATAQRGIEHQIIAAEGPLARDQVPLFAKLSQLPRRMMRRYHYAYKVDIAAVLDAISA